MESRRSLSGKIILLVEVLLLLSSAIFCGISISRSRVGIRKAIQQRMVDIANCAAGSVNGDILEKLTTGDEGTPEYQTVYDSMAVFRDNAELEYIYSIRDEGNGRFTFIVDTDPDEPGAFGDEVKYTEALDQASRGTTAVDEVPYSDQWGEFYSAYSPVYDSAGRIAGIVAADFSVAWFDAQLREQTVSTVRDYSIILLITLLAAAVLCVVTVRPFVRMQAQLLEEKVTAESASQAKSDFLASMSHEIRTPINAMLGMNEMILRESRQGRKLQAGQTEEVRAAFDQIGSYARDAERAGGNLLAIINDILDFSRIEAGRMELAEAPYHLSDVLDDLSTMIRVKAEEKGLAFTVQTDESLPDSLLGDEVRIREIISNLLNNAVKYTEHGFVRFTVRGGDQDGDTVRLIFTVEDSGIGIRRRDMDKLFSKFKRLEMERNSTVEGSGLGLVITRSLVDMMNGTIQVQSEYGKGSVFTVTIPQKIAADSLADSAGEQLDRDDGEESGYREAFHAPEARILIVDDTKMNLIVTAGLLKKTEIQIDMAESGAEALELAEGKTYDVVLLDQRMPEMDGTETLRRLRQLKNNPNSRIPVICLTADAIIGAKERYLADGFTDYLTKPVNSRQLEAMLMKYLPERKVVIPAGTETSGSGKELSAGAGNGEPFALLREAGIDPDSGLMYCRNDRKLYGMLLQEYAESAAERIMNMQRFFGTEDWKDYGIQAHSLKSTSRTIGAETLAGDAAALEKAALEDCAALIREKHDAVMKAYRRTADAALQAAAAENPEDPKKAVLEFWPEEE